MLRDQKQLDRIEELLDDADLNNPNKEERAGAEVQLFFMGIVDADGQFNSKAALLDPGLQAIFDNRS